MELVFLFYRNTHLEAESDVKYSLTTHFKTIRGRREENEDQAKTYQ